MKIFLPIGLVYCISCKHLPKGCTRRTPNVKYMVPTFFGDQSVGNVDGLRTYVHLLYKPSSQELRD
jgi:hypothetical protein